MEVSVKPGKYIVAVSGGVDSMVLLDLLSKQPGLELIVAHFDHGIRPDSHIDAKLVEGTAKKYGLSFELGEGRLGRQASEEQARKARYKFLFDTQEKHKADKVVTAHQIDDVIETALINILRGTSPRGLVSILANEAVLRPMLGISKSEIINYAKKNKVAWRQDPTNEETKYLRNYIRKNVTSKLNQSQKQVIIKNIDKVAEIQKSKEELIGKITKTIRRNDEIDRQRFTLLPAEVGAELVAGWLRQLGYRQFDKKTVDKANLLIRTAKPGTQYDLSKNTRLNVGKFFAKFEQKAEK